MAIVHSLTEQSEFVSSIFWRDFVRGVSMIVRDEDEMYRLFFYRHGENRDRALLMYFNSGRSIWQAIEQIAIWRFGSLSNVSTALEVGAGFGRVARFMAASLGTSRVRAVEIQESACEALHSDLGIDVTQSTFDPECLRLGNKADLIVASSLLTHLPENRARQWVARLSGHLTERGLLLISVHGACDSVLGEAADFEFRQESESVRLPLSEYGSAWLSEAWFRGIVGEYAPGFDCLRLGRAFAATQDVYVVGRNLGQVAEDRLLAPLVECQLELFSVEANGRLLAKGWIADRVRRRKPVATRLIAPGVSVESTGDRILDRREDVQAVLAPGEEAYGFQLALQLSWATPYSEQVALRVEFEDGSDQTLLEGSLSELALRALEFRFADANERLQRAEQEVAWMRSSRFWRMRDWWWRIRPRAFRGAARG